MGVGFPGDLTDPLAHQPRPSHDSHIVAHLLYILAASQKISSQMTCTLSSGLEAAPSLTPTWPEGAVADRERSPHIEPGWVSLPALEDAQEPHRQCLSPNPVSLGCLIYGLCSALCAHLSCEVWTQRTLCPEGKLGFGWGAFSSQTPSLACTRAPH